MKEIAAALVKAQKAFGPALKNSVNPHLRNKYANLQACLDAVMEAMNNAGIFLYQRTEPSESGVTIETIFLHESGESLSAGKLYIPASKQDAQGFGSAESYARRYSLMAACGIAAEDDDGEAAKARPAPPRAVPTAYPDDAFQNNLPKWGEIIAMGKKTAEEVIALVGAKATLNDAQKQAIRQLEAA